VKGDGDKVDTAAHDRRKGEGGRDYSNEDKEKSYVYHL
jgi:hypothetical protein